MPGIVGCLTQLPRECAVEKVLQMLELLRHESFYVTGLWVEEALGIYIGWVTRKDSFSDGMPLRNERGDVVLAFSGEEFPVPGTERRLKEQGHELNGPGPSYLVHLYEEDPSFPAGLNGRFHGVLIDRNRKHAVLFNDRYGMHRIYYRESRDGFFFASEAKAILAACPETRNMDLRGFGEFVTCGCTLENRSLFEGVYVLPGGAKWVLRRGSVAEKHTYFKAEEWENQEPLETEPYYRGLRDIFCHNLPRYFGGREPIGMSLTGGLDTRMLMAWQNCSAGSLRCYTFGGSLRKCQDVTLARQLASLCAQPHEVIETGEEFLSSFSHYAERSVFLTDGCVDVSRAPDLYLNLMARNIAPVRVSGVYGGEILRQVRTFKPEHSAPGLFAGDLHPFMKQARETYAALCQRQHPVSFAIFKQAPWSQYGVLALEETQLSVRCPFLDNDLVKTIFRAPASALSSAKICLRLIADGNRGLLKLPTDRGVAGNGEGLFGPARRALLEFLFRAEYAYDIGMPQWLAMVDHKLAPLHLERFFLGRHKIFHFRIWYRDALAEYVQDILLDSRSLSRPYIDRSGLRSIVAGHISGNRNHSSDISKVLGLELLQRLLLDKQNYTDHFSFTNNTNPYILSDAH